MKVHFLTIVLDGMPWISGHLHAFNRLKLDWHWHIVEGVASPTHCTQWCKRIHPRLSIDGTTEYLNWLKAHKRVSVYQKDEWDGKIEMVNAPLHFASGDGLLWQVDCDEMWTAEQIEVCAAMFAVDQRRTHAQFKCRYFFGPDIVITSENTYGNRYDIEWYRVWRWREGVLFDKHEPPMLKTDLSKPFKVSETAARGLVFDHYAYATEEAVAFKETYYGYKDAVKHWRRLQENKTWPAKLSTFIPWVKDNAMVSRL